ncbi:NAD(P)-dependent alcohol dehydrogenase [Streptomyces sp. M19]
MASTFHPAWLYGPFRGWGELYGVQSDGWLAEYVAVDEQSVVGVPEHLSFEEAATLPCAALTAWSAVAGIGPGTRCSCRVRRRVRLRAPVRAPRGARVLATTSSEEKSGRLRALGASDVVDYVRTPEWGAPVRELTGGRGVDVVVEIGGAGTVDQSVAALADGGRISLVGNLASGGGLDLTRFLYRGATLKTVIVGSRSDFEDMNRVIERHRLRPVVDRVFPFDRAPEAFAYFAQGSRFGKVVIAH